MKIEIRNRCSDFNSYRAARVKSLFNAESGCSAARYLLEKRTISPFASVQTAPQ
jgi:hypothetical protein